MNATNRTSPSRRRGQQNAACCWGTDPKGKRSKRTRRLQFVDSGAKAIIDRLQPHHRGDDAKNHPLAVLNELANEGKHRKILLAILIANVDKVTFRHFGGPVLPITQARTPTRRYEADAELKVFDSTRAMPEKDIEVVGDPRGDVAFDVAGPASGVSVIEFLAAAHRNIRKEVFEPLEAFLT